MSLISSGNTLSLTDKFDVLKDIGDGSFGSVVLAKVRSAGSSVARRGSVVAIKTMKKTFESFAPCLELREVIFLQKLPPHPHLVPALDIFLDPTTRKLHIAMEYMDGNLYQLMKSRDHKCLDQESVKSILYQIMSGLEHIHAQGFFHRDIKPENILVSTSAGPSYDSNAPFRRYSSMTPPATPGAYTVKIADFGLAREMHSKVPYTTYVSTRWYRAPEVLLRAGEYSAPVDIWAVGAMAVEIATLKPLFPGSNEVDQVWRVCEVMGSPGNWQSRSGRKIGGGEWKDGIRLAQKLGFSFPRMTPQSIEQHYLPLSQWPASLSQFVTSCLLWDPRGRPTSTQALAHEYFVDAIDPLKPKPIPQPQTRALRSRQSELARPSMEQVAQPTPQSNLNTKHSWFRKSFAGTNTASVVQISASTLQSETKASPKITQTEITAPTSTRQPAEKRSTWHGLRGTGAPIPILPTIRPITPLSDTVHAQANNHDHTETKHLTFDEKSGKKLGRQLSTNSQQQYTNPAHAAALSSLNGGRGVMSPPGTKEGIFSHFRKRVRRLSGRTSIPVSPADDIEAQVGCGPWSSNRSSMIIDQVSSPTGTSSGDFKESSREYAPIQVSEIPNIAGLGGNNRHSRTQLISPPPSMNSQIKRNPSYPPRVEPQSQLTSSNSKARRQMARNSAARYETPDEEEELLDEVLVHAAKAMRKLERGSPVLSQQGTPERTVPSHGYPTPPSHKQQKPQLQVVSMGLRTDAPSKGRKRSGQRNSEDDSPIPKWNSPLLDNGNWAASAAATAYAGSKR
ncbi:hypothetical protein TWF569_010647 [Orbilia oligospora]|uniref:Protein kinase domain-containing protein n=1 Tax=Orbilia oligospora TaxID=2813651 RepID=A0A7C8J4F5_ORBOL|nr:hypothetical protein TWF102_007703 [Orbilia oligospora]KAF3100548.1 hypothetical protein TWF706_006108 [Orbilia oligospora]KAF3100549.1 hypothetical protein TWF706_006108 [Orbilia oligospora]KAF3101382.1 hypothetical protein TWF103_007956 [Orbilia oligospora]KAF3101383.1 hypothetical protein TWF103_007956 [Orbilia oligospora]